MQDGDDDLVTKRIESALTAWRAPGRRDLLQKHIDHWSASPPRRDAARDDLALLSEQIEETFRDEAVVAPAVLGELAPARRVALYLGFAPGQPDHRYGPWESMRPACKYKSQMAHLASRLQCAWEALGPERSAGRPWVDLGAYAHCVAFCVPCVPCPEWMNEQTKERVPPLVLRYAAFYLLTALRVLRPACVVVGNYEAAKMLTFVHEYAHCKTADAWLGAAPLDRAKMVCPQVHQTAYVRIGPMGFHAFRFHVPFYADKLAESDPDGVAQAFEDGVVRMMETLNPMPRDALASMQPPDAKAARVRRSSVRGKPPSVRGQPALSFVKKNA